jgi:hypothetical protein
VQGRAKTWLQSSALRHNDPRGRPSSRSLFPPPSVLKQCSPTGGMAGPRSIPWVSPWRYGRNDHRGGSLTLLLPFPLSLSPSSSCSCLPRCTTDRPHAARGTKPSPTCLFGRDDSVRALCPVPAHHLPRVPVIGAGRLATGQSRAFGRSPVNASAGSLTPPGGREALTIRSADPAVGM